VCLSKTIEKYRRKNSLAGNSIAYVQATSDTEIVNQPAYIVLKDFVDIYSDQVRRIEVVRIKPCCQFSNMKNVHFHQVVKPFEKSGSRFLNVLGFAIYQLALTFKLAVLRVGVIYFHIGGSLLITPLIVMKLLGRKIVLMGSGEPFEKFYEVEYEHRGKKIVLDQIRILEHMSFRVADLVVLESKNEMPAHYTWGIEKKVMFLDIDFIDSEVFKKKKPFKERKVDLIFVGVLSKNKGVMELIEAVDLARKAIPNLKLFVAGTGSMLETITRFVHSHGLEENVKLLGWVDRLELPRYLNDAKFMILPSYSEGVPKAVLESMACGAIPIVTPVGGIPDVVTDGKTVYILQNNNPETIAEKIIQLVAGNKDLNETSDSARRFVIFNYSYEKLKQEWKKLLERLIGVQ
jgi:glycosyltransferase involved in cell wall biosynthesis